MNADQVFGYVMSFVMISFGVLVLIYAAWLVKTIFGKKSP